MIRRSSGVGLVTAAVATFIFALASHAQMSPAVMGTVAETAPIPGDQVPKPIKDAVASPDRPADDVQLDAGRKPEQMLAFFGVAPGMKVADIFAGGGYMTELLSKIVGPRGRVYSQNPVFPPKFKNIEDAWDARLKKPALRNVIAVHTLDKITPGSLDLAITNLNYHDMVLFKADRASLNASIMKALKPGGFYCIVDHSAKDGSGLKDLQLHRIDEQYVIDEVQKSGFKLAAASSALRHPEDDRSWMVFKKRGQTDRFMLKFAKPQ